MKTPHKHAELIRAWADGEEIEYQQPQGTTWVSNEFGCFYSDYKYRVKPTPKPDVILYANAQAIFQCTDSFSYELIGNFNGTKTYDDNIVLTYDGETGKLKSVELIK